MEDFSSLVERLRSYKNETEWLEFKHNNYDPDMIGKDISALANSAALCERDCAYMLWGINDNTHEIIGTDYNLQALKVGKQEVESWLRDMLSPNANFEFFSVDIHDKKVGILIIYRSASQTVMFKGVDYIRIGSYSKKLSEYPQQQAKLWSKIGNYRFEEQPAMKDLTLSEALSYLDYIKYFDMIKLPVPSESEGIVHFLIEENIVHKQDDGNYLITNLGAILFAKNLHNFKRLSKKAVRVVKYAGDMRIDIQHDTTFNSGYAVCFEEIINHILALTPSDMPIDGALRSEKRGYPSIAIREAVANALIHQEFSLIGTCAKVEIFDHKIEITNPGIPLVDTIRIIDNPPQSRNEYLADLMRRLRICEELGSGWDKIAMSCELKQLPAPKIEICGENTKVTLYTEIPYSSIALEDKIWTCYLHAVIQHLKRENLTNASLRERFGLQQNSNSTISRLIGQAVESRLIKPLDPDTAPRYMAYIPFWA